MGTFELPEHGNIAFNCDCMELMKTLPDNYFDLCVTDPPYGDGRSQPVNVERERETGTARTGKERATAGRKLGICEVAATADGSDSTVGARAGKTRGTSTSCSRQPLRFHGGDRWNKYLSPQSSVLSPQSSVSGQRTAARR